MGVDLGGMAGYHSLRAPVESMLLSLVGLVPSYASVVLRAIFSLVYIRLSRSRVRWVGEIRLSVRFESAGAAQALASARLVLVARTEFGPRPLRARSLSTRGR